MTYHEKTIYLDGALHALLFLRDWLEYHSESLNGYAGEEAHEATDEDREKGRRAIDGMVVMSLKYKKPPLRKKQNAFVRLLIDALMKDVETFMKYGDSTDVRFFVDDKNNVNRITVEKSEEVNVKMVECCECGRETRKIEKYYDKEYGYHCPDCWRELMQCRAGE